MHFKKLQEAEANQFLGPLFPQQYQNHQVYKGPSLLGNRNLKSNETSNSYTGALTFPHSHWSCSLLLSADTSWGAYHHEALREQHLSKLEGSEQGMGSIPESRNSPCNALRQEHAWSNKTKAASGSRTAAGHTGWPPWGL